MTIIRIESTADAKTFVENSGITECGIGIKNSGITKWEFTGRASADGFAAWIRANRSEINTEDYAADLCEYLVSVGENPADYSLDR